MFSVANMVSDIVFALSRISTIILSLVTFSIGLTKSEKPEIERPEGDYNTLLVRIGAFLLVVVLQLYLLFYFIRDHSKQLREIKIPIRSLLKQQPLTQKKNESVKFSQKKKSKLMIFSLLS